MAKEIMICPKCHEYTLKGIHCNINTITIKPAKFSPDDKWGIYRRKEKKRRLNQNDMEN